MHYNIRAPAGRAPAGLDQPAAEAGQHWDSSCEAACKPASRPREGMWGRIAYQWVAPFGSVDRQQVMKGWLLLYSQSRMQQAAAHCKRATLGAPSWCYADAATSKASLSQQRHSMPQTAGCEVQAGGCDSLLLASRFICAVACHQHRVVQRASALQAAQPVRTTMKSV